MYLKAVIAGIKQETPTVRSFLLDLDSRSLPYLPGQWVDCHAEIDGVPEIAGYSMTSAPASEGSIELAVKRVGGNPVTAYLHTVAKPGDVLYVDGGQGDFFFRPGMAESLVLVAGGIGLNPLMSILTFIDATASEVRAVLVYSVTTPAELLFRERLEGMAARNRKLRVLFTVTRPGAAPWPGRTGRIDAAMLREAGLENDPLCYVCGPPSMTDDMAAMLNGLGVPPARVKVERWW